MKNGLLKDILYSGLFTASLFSSSVLADTPASTNWAGPYIGGHGGYAWGDFRNSAGVAGPDGSGDSWLGGAQIGTNWQFDRIVLGVEGDASKMDILTKNPSSTFDETGWRPSVGGRGIVFINCCPLLPSAWV